MIEMEGQVSTGVIKKDRPIAIDSYPQGVIEKLKSFLDKYKINHSDINLSYVVYEEGSMIERNGKTYTATPGNYLLEINTDTTLSHEFYGSYSEILFPKPSVF